VNATEKTGVWEPGGTACLSFPTRASAARGTSVVQIQRMVHPGLSTDGSATPDGRGHDIIAGEMSILEQYERAIDAARSSIYIENQALAVPAIARRLEFALRRGVEIILLVPAEPESHVRKARLAPARSEFFECVEMLDHHKTFTLVGFNAPYLAGRSAIYVHAKAMLVDDAWATVGSCNLHANSLSGHTEMNASIWDPAVVRTLRCQLLAEHLNHDTNALSDRAALQLYRRIAECNRLAKERNDDGWQGLAFALDPAEYGR